MLHTCTCSLKKNIQYGHAELVACYFVFIKTNQTIYCTFVRELASWVKGFSNWSIPNIFMSLVLAIQIT